jgi:hypothetical protein
MRLQMGDGVMLRKPFTCDVFGGLIFNNFSSTYFIVCIIYESTSTIVM